MPSTSLYSQKSFISNFEWGHWNGCFWQCISWIDKIHNTFKKISKLTENMKNFIESPCGGQTNATVSAFCKRMLIVWLSDSIWNETIIIARSEFWIGLKQTTIEGPVIVITYEMFTRQNKTFVRYCHTICSSYILHSQTFASTRISGLLSIFTRPTIAIRWWPCWSTTITSFPDFNSDR